MPSGRLHHDPIEALQLARRPARIDRLSPPAAGRQFFLVHVTAVFNGPGIAVAWEVLLGGLIAVGSSQIAYTQTDLGNCGTVPDDLADVEQVFPGATVTGNVCWSVSGTDAQGLLVYWLDGATQQPAAWFALR